MADKPKCPKCGTNEYVQTTNHLATAGAVIGGGSILAGAVAGATTGVAVGATAGSVVPVVGNLVGAVGGATSGAIIGAIGAAFAGSTGAALAGKKLAELTNMYECKKCETKLYDDIPTRVKKFKDKF